MAKQKSLQQLNLFQNFFHEPKNEKSETIENPIEQIVFANEKIAVKIKPKDTLVNEIDKKETPISKETKPATIKLPVVPKQKKIYKPKITISNNKRGRKSFKQMDEEIELVKVPDDETLKKKLYYPISEVASFFNENTSLIRAWENEFDILKPRKNRKGDRLFRFEDIKNLQIIYYLLRNKKFSVDGAKKYLKENRGKVDTNQQIVQSLTRLKSFLTDLKNNL